MISVVWRKRALPIYWVLLEKKGSSNVKEQIALIRPVLRLFCQYELVILGDREFHGVELSYWLKKKLLKKSGGTRRKLGDKDENKVSSSPRLSLA